MSGNIAALNGKLCNWAYVSGSTPTKDDADAFKEMFGDNTAVIQWAARMANYCQSERDEILDPVAAARKKENKKNAQLKKNSSGGEGETKKSAQGNSSGTVVEGAEFVPIPGHEKFVSKKELVSNPSGDLPIQGGTLTVHYVGTFADKPTVEFDSSVKRGEKFSFVLGTSAVIQGWDVGMATMRVGEKAVLRVHSEYAYGEKGDGADIPKNAELLFEVEVFGFKKAAADALPAVTVELLANFSKFAEVQKNTKLQMVWIEVTLKKCAEQYTAAQIDTMLTKSDNCDALLDKYVSMSKVSANDTTKVRAELTALVKKFADAGATAPKLAAPKNDDAPVHPEACLTLLANFEEFAATQTLKHTTMEGIKETLEFCKGYYHHSEIETMLTEPDDCDDLLEKYTAICNVPAKDAMRARNELIAIVEGYVESLE